jgi:glucokinase
LRGVGVGAPNADHLQGTIEDPPNLEWERVDLRAAIGEYSDLPVSVINDANAAALGEAFLGSARKFRSFLQVTLGTGIGTGVVLNGELWQGEHGFAGEIGHSIVEPKGRQCGCGRLGCLETYASASGLVRNLIEQKPYFPESILLQRDPESISASDVYEAAQRDDKAALAAFEMAGKYLGLALANATTLLDLEAFVLSGGVALAGEFLLDPVRRHFDDNLLDIYRGGVEVVLSELKGADAAVLGAAAFAWQELKR